MEEEKLGDSPSREIERDASQSVHEKGDGDESSRGNEDEHPPGIIDETTDEDLPRAMVKETDQLHQENGDGSSSKIEEESTDEDPPLTKEDEKSPNPLDAALSKIGFGVSPQKSDRRTDRPRSLNVCPIRVLSQSPEFLSNDAPCWLEIARALTLKVPEEMIVAELGGITETRLPDTLTSSDVLQLFYRLCTQNAVFPLIVKLKKKNIVKVEENYDKCMKKIKSKEKDNYFLHVMSSMMLANAEVGSREYCLASAIRGQVLLDDKKYIHALVDFNRALKCENLTKKTRDDVEKNRHTCITKIRMSKNEELWTTLRNVVKGVQEWQKKKSGLKVTATSPASPSMIPRPIRKAKEKSESYYLTDEESESGMKVNDLLTNKFQSVMDRMGVLEESFPSQETGSGKPQTVSKSDIETDENGPARKVEPSQSQPVDDVAVEETNVATETVPETREAPSKPPRAPKFFATDSPQLLNASATSSGLPIEITQLDPLLKKIVTTSSIAGELSAELCATVEEADTSLDHESDAPTPGSYRQLPLVQLNRTSEPLNEEIDETKTNVELIIQIVDNKTRVSDKTTLTLKTGAKTRISDLIRNLKEIMIFEYEPLSMLTDGLKQLRLDERLSVIASEISASAIEEMDRSTVRMENVLSEATHMFEKMGSTDPKLSKKTEAGESTTRVGPDTVSSNVKLGTVVKEAGSDPNDDGSTGKVKQNASAEKLETIPSDSVGQKKKKSTGEESSSSSSRVIPRDTLEAQDELKGVNTEYTGPVQTEMKEESKSDTLQDAASKGGDHHVESKGKKRRKRKSPSPDKAKNEEFEKEVESFDPSKKSKSKQQSGGAKGDKQSKKKGLLTSPKRAYSPPPVSRESISSLRESIQGWEDLCDLNFDWKFVPPKGNLTNEILPNASPKIKLVENEEWGRHFIATEELNPGEVLIVDTPYVLLRYSQYAHTHCAFCTLRCEANIPCIGCSVEMYCGESCREKAWNSYHQVECQIIEYLIGGEAEKWFAIAIRTLLIASDQGKSLVRMRKHPVYRKVFEKNMDMNTRLRTNEFICIHNLMDDCVSHLNGNLCVYFQAVYLVYLLKHTTFFDEWKKDQQDFKLTDLEIYVGNVLMKLLMTARLNCNVIYYDQSKVFFTTGGRTAFDECEIGFGIFPLLSYLNHSCDANTTLYSAKDKFVLYATHQIMPGEQIFANYGSQYFDNVTDARRGLLLDRFFFVCRCNACEEDWSLAGMWDCVTWPALLEGAIIDENEFTQMKNNAKQIRKSFKSGKDMGDEFDWLVRYLKYIREHFKTPNYEYYATVATIKMIVRARTDCHYAGSLTLRQIYPETPATEPNCSYAEFLTRMKRIEVMCGSRPNFSAKYKRLTRKFQD